MKNIKTIFVFLLYVSQLFSQEQFTEMLNINLPGYSSTCTSWADYDNDGDLDILLTGTDYNYTFSKVYRNNENSTFVEQTTISLVGVWNGAVSWGDYNNDSYVDILMIGNDPLGRKVSKIYSNNGDNTFTEQTSISLTNFSAGDVSWGDYDNDGDLDILLIGSTEVGRASKIYKNNGNNTFTEQTSISLIDINNGSIAWGDYDNDGDLDIFMSGAAIIGGFGTAISKVFCNNGNNTFSEQTSNSFIGIHVGDIAWGDYDNDGYLDILITGQTSSSGPVSKIYRNNRDGTFTEQPQIILTAIWKSSVAWGDYDNDGFLDIFMAGTTSEENSVTKIYHNNGDKTFTEQNSIILPGISGCVSWADYDNDGDLDILIAGSSITKIYRNNNITFNTLPTIPTNLQSIVSQHGVSFSWDKSTDNETPQDGLKYNLVIGTSSNAVNVFSPMSDRNTGFRRVINLGNTNHNNSWTINNLNSGQTYYWSVQAVDNTFSGSNFASEKILVVTSIDGELMQVLPKEFNLEQNYPNPFNPSTKISWQSPVSGWQTLKVYDVLGREVATLVDEFRNAGNYDVEFNPVSNIRHPASGVYFYQLKAGEFVATKKMMILK